MSLIFLSSFTIPQQVVAQKRPRARYQPGKDGKAGYTRVFQPKICNTFQNLVTMIAQEAWKMPVLQTEPIFMQVEFYLPVPKSAPKKNLKMMLEDLIRPTKKPDLDNALKGIQDGMASIVYRDDSQIVTALLAKFYDVVPRTEVKIWKIVPDGKSQTAIIEEKEFQL